MQVFDTLADLSAFRGQVGPSSWHVIEQTRIDRFAEATGDDYWIHTDPERAARELGGPTIAHGYLTLSMIPVIMYEMMTVKNLRQMLNYGSNRVRFMAPVAAGSRIRGRARLVKSTARDKALMAAFEVTIEIEGSDKPALVAETLTMFYE